MPLAPPKKLIRAFLPSKLRWQLGQWMKPSDLWKWAGKAVRHQVHSHNMKSDASESMGSEKRADKILLEIWHPGFNRSFNKYVAGSADGGARASRVASNVSHFTLAGRSATLGVEAGLRLLRLEQKSESEKASAYSSCTTSKGRPTRWAMPRLRWSTGMLRLSGVGSAGSGRYPWLPWPVRRDDSSRTCCWSSWSNSVLLLGEGDRGLP